MGETRFVGAVELVVGAATDETGVATVLMRLRKRLLLLLPDGSGEVAEASKRTEEEGIEDESMEEEGMGVVGEG